MRGLLVQIGQGESLVHFFVSGFGNSPKSGRSSGEERNYDENPEKLPLSALLRQENRHTIIATNELAV